MCRQSSLCACVSVSVCRFVHIPLIFMSLLHRVNIEPKSRFKRVENGNYAIEIAKQLKFSLINIGGLDIIDGNKKMVRLRTERHWLFILPTNSLSLSVCVCVCVCVSPFE